MQGSNLRITSPSFIVDVTQPAAGQGMHLWLTPLSLWVCWLSNNPYRNMIEYHEHGTMISCCNHSRPLMVDMSKYEIPSPHPVIPVVQVFTATNDRQQTVGRSHHGKRNRDISVESKLFGCQTGSFPPSAASSLHFPPHPWHFFRPQVLVGGFSK